MVSGALLRSILGSLPVIVYAFGLSLDARAARLAAADLRRLHQVVLNLVSNAIKFTPEGGRVALRSYRRHATVTVVVSDTGVGISRPDQERIFDDYYQVPGAGRAVVVGTGLGLGLSRRPARAMGGELSVRSRPGRGSSFLVSLPLWIAR